jgi:hypothetical protein
MSTTRQAYRLNTRTSATRLMGIYYGHTGHYLGQLHTYHTTYGLLALTFVGTIAQGVGLLPYAAWPASALMGIVFGPFAALFLLTTMLPLVFALIVEKGIVAAILEPISTVLHGSPLYFIFQSRCIGAGLAGEFSSGGIAYIATGRGLAIDRQKFKSLFGSFTTQCLYPGVDMAILLFVPPFVVPQPGAAALSLPVYVIAAMVPFALLFGPALFNPQSFAGAEQCDDIKDWLGWMRGDEKRLQVLKSKTEDARSANEKDELKKLEGANKNSPFFCWRIWHMNRCGANKYNVRAHAFLLPSKEMIVSALMLLISAQVLRKYDAGHSVFSGVSVQQLALLVLPIEGFLAVIFGSVSHQVLNCTCLKGKSTYHICAAVCALFMIVVEAFYLRYTHSLSASEFSALMTAHYFAAKWVCNTLTHMCAAYRNRNTPKKVKMYEAAANEPASYFVAYFEEVVASLAFVADGLLGFFLLMPVAFFSIFNCNPICRPLGLSMNNLHTRWLFGFNKDKMGFSTKTTSPNRVVAPSAAAANATINATAQVAPSNGSGLRAALLDRDQ